MGHKFEQGCFVDCDGVLKDVANPGEGLTCKVEGDTVLLLGPHDEEDGADVIGEYCFYPTIDALLAQGFKLGPDGELIPLVLEDGKFYKNAQGAIEQVFLKDHDSDFPFEGATTFFRYMRDGRYIPERNMPCAVFNLVEAM